MIKASLLLQTPKRPRLKRLLRRLPRRKRFQARLRWGSAASYAFAVTESGTVNVTLVEVGGTLVPPTIMLGMGIGTPSGRGCSSNPTMVQPGSEPQVTGTFAPGRYCVGLSDVGNLLAPATFLVTIAHP